MWKIGIRPAPIYRSGVRSILLIRCHVHGRNQAPNGYPRKKLDLRNQKHTERVRDKLFKAVRTGLEQLIDL